MPHLVVSISGHGFGHVAQTAPILNRLHRLMPQLRITIRSTAPVSHLRSRIHAPFEHMASEGDIGMLMSSALDVRVEDSRTAYRAFHENWQARVDDEARLLRDLGANMVLSNVGYLPLAGAQHAGIPNAAMCSLNWFDIYRHYCGDDEVAAQIRECYVHADAFLRATPGMAMDYLPNLVPVEPIADIGTNRRDALNRHLRLSQEERLILVSMGGINSRLPMERWPHIPGVRYLVQGSWKIDRPDATMFESLPVTFGDLLASCDVLLCKPGYGSFVEAACSSVPVLYVDRSDWPESPALTEWLQHHGQCRELSRQTLEAGNIATDIELIRNLPHPPTPLPAGGEQVADWIEKRLRE
jgi:hypothetical protein